MTDSLPNDASWSFLYIGPQAIGWLNAQDQLVNPLHSDSSADPVVGVAASESGQRAGHDNLAVQSISPSPATDVKRRYLQHYLSTTQSARCAIVLDNGSGTIAMKDPQQTAATDPFYVSGLATQHAVSLSRGKSSVVQDRAFTAHSSAGSSLGDQHSSDLSVTSTLQRRADRFAQWPGQRSRTPVVSRHTLFSDQQQTLEWHELLVELTGRSVAIYAYPLVVEFLLQPLVGELDAALVVAVQPDTSVRHLFFRKGWLHFARQLPLSPGDAEKHMHSTDAYVRQHLKYVESYPVFDCVSGADRGVRALQCRTPMRESSVVKSLDTENELFRSNCVIEPVNQALRHALLQQEREFYFAVRRQAVDNLKRWRLESSKMTLQRRKHTQAARVRAVKAAATVLTLVSGLSLVPSIAAMWQLSQQHAQTLRSLVSRSDTAQPMRTPEVDGASIQTELVHELPAALLKNLVGFPVELYRQSYAEPATVLLHLQDTLSNYPQLLVDKVDWQWLQSEQSPLQSLASQLNVSSTNLRSRQSSPAVDLAESSTLQVSVAGHVALSQFSGHPVNSIGRDLAAYESFLIHLKKTFGLQTLQQVNHPFGASPGSRLHQVTSASEPAFATRTLKDAIAFRRYSFEFSLDGAKVAGLLHRMNDSPPSVSGEGVSDPT